MWSFSKACIKMSGRRRKSYNVLPAIVVNCGQVFPLDTTEKHTKDNKCDCNDNDMEAGFEPGPKAMSLPKDRPPEVPSITISSSSPQRVQRSPSPRVDKAINSTAWDDVTPRVTFAVSDRTSRRERHEEDTVGTMDSKRLKDGLNSSSKYSHRHNSADPSPSRLSGSYSDPNLFKHQDLPPATLLDAMDSATNPRRKDSVSRIRKRSTIATNATARRRKSSVTSACFLSKQQRRHSVHFSSSPVQISRDLYGSSPPREEQGGFDEDVDFQSWSHLLSSIPQEERRTSQVRRSFIKLVIPICTLGKENPVSFTTIDAIEQSLRRHYPEVLLKKKSEVDPTSSPLHSILTEEPADSSPISSLGDNTNLLSPKTLNAYRKMSINTCISSMRKDRGDYDEQLNGVKNVGAFAQEETLKVLFAKSEAIACILEAMKEFPEKEELITNACVSLLKMASASESNCVYILQNGGISAISSTLRKHLENPTIVKMLLNTVAYISTAVDLASTLVAGGVHSEVLKVMSRHANNRDIVRESCFIIGNLLTTVETAHQLMLVGGVHTILGMAERYPDDEKVQENTCRTLGSFAGYDETCLDVALAGATETVIRALTSQRSNVTVVECGAWALANLTASDQTCDELVRLGGIDVIVDIMEGYPQEENVHDYGVRVLCNLSSCDSTVAAVCGHPKLVELLQNVMTNFPDSVELLEITLVALSQLVVGEEDDVYPPEPTLATMSMSRCARDVVTVMLNNPENSLIQEHGCKVIGNMAVNPCLRKQVEVGGASKAVISALLSLDTCADIQEVGCLALMNLTADNKDNKVRIKNAGAVPTLLNTLREFDHDSTVVLCALKALGNLVSLDEVCHLLLDESGLDTLVSIVDIHLDHIDIQVFMAMVLCGITELPDLKDHETSLIDKTLMKILESIEDDPDVTLYVCQAIENMIVSDSGRETFLREGRMQVILQAMTSFTDSRQIHQCCCKVLAMVVLYVDTKKRLTTDTTVRCVLRSMELFPDDVELQIVGCGTLSCIIEKISILKHELICQRGISLIHKAVSTFPTEARLAVVALLAIGHVLPLDDKSFPLEAENAFRVIMMCMAGFVENKEIQISGCVALSKGCLHHKDDMPELVNTVTHAIRRHGDQQEVQRVAALALRQYKHKSLPLDSALNSPSFKANDLFWQTYRRSDSS